MATFLRDIYGNYVNVGRISSVSAKGGHYYARFNEGDECSGNLLSLDIWLNYLGVPEGEKVARFKADRDA
jgi:hypothetical protein